VANGNGTMRAAVQEAYGPPEVLRLRDVPRPVPAGKDVLVKVHAASANALDAHLLHSVLVLRLFFGLRRPKRPIRGVDLAGVVAAVGPEVTRFKPGDRVFGSAHGSFAEYTVAPEDRLVTLRPELSFAQAAAIPVAGLTALQGLRKAGVKPGQRVLIHGAGGGVGTFAVQVAKLLGAQVTAVTGPRNLELVGSLGPDELMDYSKEDFARGGARYDVLYDVAMTRSLGDCLRVLKPGGVLMRIGAPKHGGFLRILTTLLGGLLRRPFTSRRIPMFIAKSNPADLAFLQDQVAEGKLTAAIDRHYPLAEIVEAMRYVGSGQARAKVIIDVGG
jgi:NADPH:quinone reductase-like Zn-dependent oxidoreductase